MAVTENLYAPGDRIFPVIMCGGSGTRLWPASRESLPKQFIPFFDQNGGASTFQTTAKRLSDPAWFESPTVLASNDSRFIVAEQLANAGISANIVLEPQRRDSAAAVAVAACYAAYKGPAHSVVLVVAADHLIGDPHAFVEACGSAAAGARAGFVMTLGVKPTFPATGYGYMRPGRSIADAPGSFHVERFVEKPNPETAARYVAEGYLWNSGNFLFRADMMLEELARYAPDVLEAARAALQCATIDLDFVRLDEPAFARAPKTSFDCAVMELTDRAGVVPVSFPWSDIGTWDAIWDASPRDEFGNTLRGRAEVMRTRNSLVHSSEGVLTAVVGLEGVVVVATPDAVLVSSRQGSEAVKDLVAHLRSKGHAEADEHLRMYRPWGWYQRIDFGPRFQVKRILVRPGGSLSLQKHYHRAEHWIVVRGTAEVTIDGAVQLVHENEAAYLPIGCVHRLVNPGKIPLELIEVQVGSYTGEDDIIRIEDIYGR